MNAFNDDVLSPAVANRFGDYTRPFNGEEKIVIYDREQDTDDDAWIESNYTHTVTLGDGYDTQDQLDDDIGLGKQFLPTRD